MIKLEESISAREEGFLVSHHASVQFVFAMQPQPIYLAHRSAADLQSFSLSISLSLSPPLAATYDRAPIPHINTPSKHLNYNESPTKMKIYKPTTFRSITDQHHG